ncbi:MAG: hypothetical protein J0H88_08535 [Sphingomonadales bacterium]|nr:hypothetical protein [Sphingomonadales bacterium]
MDTFILLLVVWLICGLIAAGVASSNGGSGLLGFFAGLFLGPVGVIIAMFIRGPSQKIAHQVAAGQLKRCPRCAEGVQSAAQVCRYCGHEFA